MENEENANLNELPGPMGLPVIGSLSSLISFKEKTLMQWAEEHYGPVYAVRMGSYTVLALQGYDAIHEALVEKAKSFSGRLIGRPIQASRDNKGLFFKQYDDLWKKWRNFSREGLHSIWKTIENGIVEETEYFLQSLRDTEDETDISETLIRSMANGVMQACFSRRFDVEDEEFGKLFTKIFSDIKNLKFQAVLFMPWLAWIPPFSWFLESVKENRKSIVQSILKLVDERLSEDRTTPDLATYFHKENPNPSSEDREELAILIEDFIFSASTTTGNQLLWVLLFLLKNSEAMNRVQSELDAVLRDCENPVKSAITDRFQQLNFCRAAIHEATRLRPIAPTSLFHYVTEDTSVMRYKVSKGTVVMPNLWSVHYDKKQWAPDPEVFRPERHLDKSGSFCKSGHVMPFSVGWRYCVGQRLAETELLAYLVAVCHNFDVTLAESDKDIDMNGVSTAILKPHLFKISLKPRSFK